MRYEEFRDALLLSWAEAGLPARPTGISETLDLIHCARHWKALQDLGARRKEEPFCATQEVSFAWSAIQTARTSTSEEDLLHELSGGNDDLPETLPRHLRIDMVLNATLPWGSRTRMPAASRKGGSMSRAPRPHATAVAVAVALGLALWLLPALPAAAADDLVFFGTHAAGPGRGLSVAHFDPATGVLTPPQLVIESPAPAFFVLRPDGRRLYACNSNDLARGWTGETISAFAVDPTTGGLTLLNRQSSGGADPSYVTLDATGRYVLTANYKGGSVAVLALNPDGSLGRRTAAVQHQGSSVDPQRQTQPYAHCIRVDPTNHFALVADLGVDKVFVYRFDQQDGSLRPHDPPFAQVAPGSGPRHLAFDPRGRFVYLINELANTIITYAWDSRRGTLDPRQTISTLPAGFVGESHCAEILVHPNGKSVYASNRGHDTLAVFAVEARTGLLRLIEHVATQGQSPRNFAFDPSRRWMIVTNHRSDNAMVFRVDGRSGRLTPQGQPVPVPNPFGLAFLALPAVRGGR